MKKSIFGRKFNRNKNQRKALIRGLISSMILHERIITTEAKAKAVKGEIEKIVTNAKKGKKRLVSPDIYPSAVDKLFNDIAKRFENRQGGYLRIVKVGERLGDKATKVYLEWTEAPIFAIKAENKKVKTTSAENKIKESAKSQRKPAANKKPTDKKNNKKIQVKK